MNGIQSSVEAAVREGRWVLRYTMSNEAVRDNLATEDELLRLLRHDLKPEEVLKLHRLFGAFHETHDDFYDEETGVALQPMEG